MYLHPFHWQGNFISCSYSNQFIFQGLLDLNSSVVVAQTAVVLSTLHYRFLRDSLDAFSCYCNVFSSSLLFFFLFDTSRGCLSWSFFLFKFLMMCQIIWLHRIVQSSVNDLIKALPLSRYDYVLHCYCPWMHFWAVTDWNKMFSMIQIRWLDFWSGEIFILKFSLYS